MKVTCTRITGIRSEAEKEFYATLKNYLKKFFEVNVSEFSNILFMLGIKLPNKIVKFECAYHTIDIAFETNDRLKIYIGDMVCPYPYIVFNDKKFFLSAKDKKVKSLSHYDMEGGRTKIYTIEVV